MEQRAAVGSWAACATKSVWQPRAAMISYASSTISMSAGAAVRLSCCRNCCAWLTLCAQVKAKLSAAGVPSEMQLYVQDLLIQVRLGSSAVHINRNR